MSPHAHDYMDMEILPANPRYEVETLDKFLCFGNNAPRNTKADASINYEIIPNRLSFSIHNDEAETWAQIQKHPRMFYFSSWMQESYMPFNSDFGPVNLSAVFHFCQAMEQKMADKRLFGRHLVFYSDAQKTHTSNTAFLLGAYLVLVEKWTPEQAAKPFEDIHPSPFKPFRDATNVPSTFDLHLIDCLRGLHRAVESRFFCYEDFNVEAYELLDDGEMADAHIICPKFLAFRGPSEDGSMGQVSKPPSDYIGLFEQLKVSAVVRLNEPHYAKEGFLKHGIKLHDLYFDDCTAPPEQVVRDFFAACEAEEGMVAVHCTAGLGRTGTLIAAWIMRKHGWSAREAMAWLRIVRPGSVIGPQQHFLELFEQRLLGRAPDPNVCKLANATYHASLAACQVKQASHRRASASYTQPM